MRKLNISNGENKSLIKLMSMKSRSGKQDFRKIENITDYLKNLKDVKK